jgi:hypothetical protein
MKPFVPAAVPTRPPPPPKAQGPRLTPPLPLAAPPPGPHDPLAETFLAELPLDLTPLSFDMTADLDVPGNVEHGFCIAAPIVRKPRLFADIPAHRIKSDNAAALVSALEMPPEGGYVDVIVGGNFIFGDILWPLCKRLGTPCRLTLSTLSLSSENVTMFRQMFADETMDYLALVLSDYFYAHERRGIYRELCDELRPQVVNGSCQIAVAGIHTKVICIESPRFKLVVKGSANLRSSENVEEFSIIRDAQAFAFHRDWHQSILARYATTLTPVRYAAAYQAIEVPQ